MVKDADLFAAAMAGVKPLCKKGRVVRPGPDGGARPTSGGATIPKERPLAARGIAKPVELALDDGSFDRDVSRALSRGKLSPEATLDLHGMTLAAAERAVASFVERATEHPHIAAWRGAFSAFGAKPKKYPCSAEALVGRVLKGQALPRINVLVDLYNAVSVAARYD